MCGTSSFYVLVESHNFPNFLE